MMLGDQVTALKRNDGVSTIVVNFNAGELLAESVAALLASPYALEVVVSDNGSHDRSLTLIRERHATDPRLKVLENGANLGFARGVNIALPHTGADYVLILNPDCIVGSDTLPRMVELMNSIPEAGMAGCVVRNPDGSEQKASRRRIPDPWIGLVRFLRLDRFSPTFKQHRLDLVDSPLPDHPLSVEAISGSFMLVRREALDEIGPLDEGYFLHCEDLDWFARFGRSRWKIYFVPDVEVVHFQGACSKARPVRVEWHKHRGMVRFFRKFQANNHTLPFRMLVVTGIWAHFAALIGIDGIRRIADWTTRIFARFTSS